MANIQAFAAEFGITIANADVWRSIGLALLLGAACWAFGAWVARSVGLLEKHAPAGETLGVGLASGLMVLAAGWATVWSGGRSSFTPVGIGFALAIALAAIRRQRRRGSLEAAVLDTPVADWRGTWLSRHRSLILTALAGGVFVVAVALIYGSTLALSPRDGVQPVGHNDPAFYAVLGRDLATTGTETNLLASGFTDLPGLPTQTWYHWAELWLASAVITAFGAAPMAVRYLIVLPIALLATAAMTGTLVRRMAGTNSRQAYLFGFLACLFLAPVPLVDGGFFSKWPAGMIFGITLYGLSATAVLLSLYGLAVLSRRRGTWGLSVFVGSTIAFIVPAHIAVALLSLVGVASVWTIRIARSLAATRRLPGVSTVWRRTLSAAGATIVATVVWGLITGHGVGVGGAPPIVAPFSASWRESVAITILGAGAFVAIGFAWPAVRSKAPNQADLYLGTAILLVVGAIAWGARLGDFTMFYLFFAGIAVIATPVAAIAVWTLWERLRATRRSWLAAGLVALCVIQLDIGVANGLYRLLDFGPQGHPPVSLALLDAIRRLPPDAKLAYTCRPLDESGPGVPQLVGIDAHTSRRVVPMCFEAEFLSIKIGAQPSVHVENLYFYWAPQRALYPNSTTEPSKEDITAFLKKHGIGYIYADAMHPNTLVPDAISVASAGGAEVLRVP